MFGKHASHLSEIFWETLENFIEIRRNLINGSIDGAKLSERLEMYALAIKDECGALENFIYYL